MGRRLTAAKLKKRQLIAEARETYQSTPRAPRAYQQSGETTELIYASLSQADVLWKVNVRVASANMLVSGTPAETPLTDAVATSLGLLRTPLAGTTPIRIKGTGQKPVRVAWYTADDTPTSRTTPWGTTSTSFAKKTGTGRDAQSHRTCPVGDATGAPTYAGIITTVNSLLTSARKLQLIGNARGGISLLPEISELSLE